MYLIMGSVTFLWSGVVYLVFPDSPETVNWLTSEEKALWQARMKEDNAGSANRDFKWSHVIESLTSLSFWCLIFMSICAHVPSGPISSFGSIIFSQMGFSPSEALLMNMPTGILAFSCILSSAIFGRRYPGILLYLISTGSCMVVMGCALVYVILHSMSTFIRQIG